ncbi:hypothetical protein [Flammeovirga agarivorans]|uniref:Outer membrane protein beta-barrel domain-containing protein n=1 Tax=Flammeovirga agarivorans TaxID=2726742 RepID=A0A7X8SGN5_9BACT|nr:hypothetical protein [Flammeovirga agarivorans]NLR89893.1 hypothetical protein [Flammeovirga agarivorans]
MRKLLSLLIVTIALLFSTHLQAQESAKSKGSGSGYMGPNNLNLGLIFAGNIGFHGDYEFNMAQDWTVGPNVDITWWNSNGNSWSAFYFACKFRWYADRAFGITNNQWDVFAQGDAGFQAYSYPDDYWKNYYNYSAFNMSIGFGGKFHFNEKVGLQASFSFPFFSGYANYGFQFGVHLNL